MLFWWPTIVFVVWVGDLLFCVSGDEDVFCVDGFVEMLLRGFRVDRRLLLATWICREVGGIRRVRGIPSPYMLPSSQSSRLVYPILRLDPGPGRKEASAHITMEQSLLLASMSKRAGARGTGDAHACQGERNRCSRFTKLSNSGGKRADQDGRHLARCKDPAYRQATMGASSLFDLALFVLADNQSLLVNY